MQIIPVLIYSNEKRQPPPESAAPCVPIKEPPTTTGWPTNLVLEFLRNQPVMPDYDAVWL